MLRILVSGWNLVAKVSEFKLMSFIYTWDIALKFFQGMYEHGKDSSNQNTKNYSDHGLVMTALIPQIRDFDVLRDAELNISVGQFVIKSASSGVAVRLGSRITEAGYRYVIFQSGQRYEFDDDQIVSALYDLFSGKSIS